PRFTPSLVQQELVAAGYLGRKSGRGFYEHGKDATPPAPVTEAARPAPAAALLRGEGALADALADRLVASGIALTRDTATDGALEISCGSVTLCLTDGRTATQRAADSAAPNTVLLDLALDYRTAKR